MSEYERAGLAGLYLSLTAARTWERQRRAWPLPNSVSERLDDLYANVTNYQARDFPLADDGYGVRLEWRAGTEIAALKAIVNWAWQVHDGVLLLPGIHRKRQHLDCYYLRIHTHNGMLGTVFQHGRTLKTTDACTRVERFDEERTFRVSYRPVSADARLPQLGKVPQQGVCDDSRIRQPLSNWAYPGSEPRFNTKGIERETGWRGPARLAYLMLFTPIAYHFVKLPGNWAYVIHNVNDMPEFQRDFLRRSVGNMSNWPFHGEVSGIEDASLRYAVRRKGAEQSFAVVVMGAAGYYHKTQKTRKNAYRNLAVADDMRIAFLRYDIFNRAFPVSNTVRPARSPTTKESGTTESHFIALPSSRERITANILRHAPWYADLAYIPFWQRDPVADECKRRKPSISAERLWLRKLQYERKQLMAMVDEDRMWDDPREKDMLDAFTRAFRRLLNRESKGLGRGGSRDLPKRWDNTMDQWHRRLLNAKTGLLLSAAVHELLALAARSPALRDGKLVEPGGPAFLLPTKDGEIGEDRRLRNHAFHAQFRRMLNHPSEWKKVRDLALLALTTFADHRLRETGGEAAADQKETHQ